MSGLHNANKHVAVGHEMQRKVAPGKTCMVEIAKGVARESYLRHTCHHQDDSHAKYAPTHIQPPI